MIFRPFYITNFLTLYSESSIMSKEEEKGKLYKEVLEWIEDNSAQFKKNGKILYDKNNLERIKRFAGAPLEYINERLEINKKVLESYHKLYQTILLAVFSSFFLLSLYELFIKPIFSQVSLDLVLSPKIEIIRNIQPTIVFSILGLVLWLVFWYSVLKLIKGAWFLKLTGLLKVIRDSEIEVYYLSKIKEYRESLKKEKR